MKTIKQLLRQPLKTLSGVLLMTLAVAILCVCVGQALAVRTTAKNLSHQFTTVAIPLSIQTDSSNSPAVEEDLLTWLEETVRENPDVIKQVARHGILSAYIPQLTPLNITSEKYMSETVTHENWRYYFYQSMPRAMPYTCAMLVITLDEVSEPVAETVTYTVEDRSSSDFINLEAYVDWFKAAEKETVTSGYTLKLTGTVTDVISLQEGYRDPVGRVARLSVTAPTLEELEEMDLVPGEQYIVYGMDYVDEYWKLIGTINWDGRYDFVQFEPFDPSKFSILSEEEREAYKNRYEEMEDGRWLSRFGYLHGIALSEMECDMVNAISLTLGLPVSLTEFYPVRDENTGKLLSLLPKEDITYTNGSGETVTYGFEEYTERYQIPTITRLEGSVEDFLQSDEGAVWQAALGRDAINNQAFAVIGVDKLSYIADFSLQNSRIVQGRDFTAEELESGARVCVIPEELAVAGGLQVGDTITTNFYSTDFGLPYQNFRTENRGILNPSASFYFETTPFTETAEYTIVGICRGESTFPDVAQGDEYAFSANTVFVPKSSVQTEMETCNSMVFVTAILQNGKIEQFHELAMRSGYAGRFRYNDQGYSIIATNFHNYESLAKQVLAVGAAVYAALLFLFLLLYPVAQNGNVRTMESLGAARSRRLGHVLASSMAVAVPGTVLGCLLGTLLWDHVVNALQTSTEAAIKLQIEPGALGGVALVQLAVALILNLCVAVLVAAPRGIPGRR